MLTDILNADESSQGRQQIPSIANIGTMAETNSPVLATKRLSAGGKTYFLDVKETQKGNKYLQITESRRGKDGQNMRNSLFLFEDKIQEFRDALDEVAAEM